MFHIGITDDEKIIGLETVGEKDSDDLCTICFYDSEEYDSETEREVSQPTVHKTKRYCHICSWDSEGNVERTCGDIFHTVCLYRWIKESKKVTCPNCQQGFNQTLDQIPELFPPKPKVVFTYHHNGEIKTETWMLNDVKHGVSKEFNVNGSLIQESNYENDKLHGVQLVYYHGLQKIRMETCYHHGKRQGLFRRYNLNGLIMEEAEFKEDQFYGPHLVRYDILTTANENELPLKSIVSYTDNGIRHGATLELDKLGNILKFINYDNGQKVGRSIERYEKDGEAQHVHTIQMHLANGNLDGYFVQYHENGTKAMECYYDDGTLVKVSTSWYTNGNLMQRSEYNDDGELHGVTRVYWRNGHAKMYHEYENGMLCGISLRYGEQGNLIERCEYQGDAPHGVYQHYYINTPVANISGVSGVSGVSNEMCGRGRRVLTKAKPALAHFKTYKHGKLHGKCKDYARDGQVIREFYMQEGALEGKFTDYIGGTVSIYKNGTQTSCRPLKAKTL